MCEYHHRSNIYQFLRLSIQIENAHIISTLGSNIHWFFIPFGILIIIGSSNAVNLTDGLDGLAIVPIIIAISVFGLIAYLVGNTIFSDYPLECAVRIYS